MRARVFEHLYSLGFEVNPRTGTLDLNGKKSKDLLRRLHEQARLFSLRSHQAWIHRSWPRLSGYFASGPYITPESIRPILVEVTEPWQRDLFRLARLTWSLPYNKGYGRRLRFLLLDEGNRGPEGQPFLMGILGLQSPPLSFPPRDRLFQYPPGQKTELVNQTMDIYALGALPPYT
ncbi:MAG: DUF4338 domain-containing protein, partial [Gloeomargarita sp. SKYB31]|nr:DUF4338 domain-containing protein [Gloeomargarita sp. SKYB31]